ncbi:MAG: type II toxin-antitoxin system RelE/ParE family toxin [Candidatus Omnitrophica bacterium]|nr:type II toxin-antitoxin system RelE/ParE family toxin [Candidatus Omnitrophota bacterium]
MRYLKNKYFHRWAKKQGVTDSVLLDAISEFEDGLYEANLGNHLFKKRVALPGRGKSGGARTILFYQQGKKLIFCFGFEKNDQSNVTDLERKLINKLSDTYQHSTEDEILSDIKYGDLIKVLNTEGK